MVQSGRGPHPVACIRAERVELYCAVLSPGENTLKSVTPANIDDSVPTEEEVEWVVWKAVKGE